MPAYLQEVTNMEILTPLVKIHDRVDFTPFPRGFNFETQNMSQRPNAGAYSGGIRPPIPLQSGPPVPEQTGPVLPL